MNFGKDDFAVRIDFSWKDTLKNDYWTSSNLNFEYFSNVFNLATLYYCLGNSIPITENELKLKEAIKYFQHSAWLFDNIKSELPSIIIPKETPNDMIADYLTYVSLYL